MADSKSQKVLDFPLLSLKLKSFLRTFKGPFYILGLALALMGINKFVLNSDYVNHHLILEYLSVLKLLIVLLVGAFLLRRFFPDLVDRAKEFGPGGAKFYPKQQKFSKEEEEQLQKVTKKESDGSLNLSTKEGRAKALEDGTLKWLLEKIYRSIFGTQIEMLYRLASFPNGLSENDLQEIFFKHKGMGTGAFQSFIEFIRYLSSHGLITYDATIKVSKITDAGRVFLDYLNQENLSSSMKSW
jgi:hypothetical protein